MYPYLICLFINIYGVTSASVGVNSVLHAILDSASDQQYKCPHLRSSNLFNPEVLKNCSNFKQAQALTQIDQNNVDSGLCILYYNNFINLCYETNKIDKSLEEYKLSNLDLNSICDTLIHNGHLVANAKPGIDTVNDILKQRCFAICTDAWNVKPICNLSAHITRVTNEFTKIHDKNAKADGKTKAQNQSNTGNINSKVDSVGISPDTASSTGQKNPELQNLPLVEQPPQAASSPQVRPVQENPKSQNSLSAHERSQEIPLASQAIPESPPKQKDKLDLIEDKTEKDSKVPSPDEKESTLKKQIQSEPNLAVIPVTKDSQGNSVNTEAKQDSQIPMLNKAKETASGASVDQPNDVQINNIPKPITKADSIQKKDEAVKKEAVKKEASPSDIDVKKETPTSSGNSTVKNAVDEFVENPFSKGSINKPIEEENALGNSIDNDGQDEEAMKDLKDDNDIEFEGPLPGGDYGNDVPPKSSEVKSKAEVQKTTEKLKPMQTDDDHYTYAANYQNQSIDDSDSYFFSYFMMFCIIFVCAYVAYHNKQKILALIVEGRRTRRPSRSRRPNSANYRKLDSNLEEAVTSTCNKSAPQVIY